VVLPVLPACQSLLPMRVQAEILDLEARADFAYASGNVALGDAIEAERIELLEETFKAKLSPIERVLNFIPGFGPAAHAALGGGAALAAWLFPKRSRKHLSRAAKKAIGSLDFGSAIGSVGKAIGWGHTSSNTAKLAEQEDYKGE